MKEFVIRVSSEYANRYHLGEKVINQVAYFPYNRQNLTKDELAAAVQSVRATGGRIVGS